MSSGGKSCTLVGMRVGDRARIRSVGGDVGLEQRLTELGVIPGVEVELVRLAPLGDPMEFELMGYRLSLRRSEAEAVAVEPA
jgi:ferrous iron transport protein B